MCPPVSCFLCHLDRISKVKWRDLEKVATNNKHEISRLSCRVHARDDTCTD